MRWITLLKNGLLLRLRYFYDVIINRILNISVTFLPIYIIYLFKKYFNIFINFPYLLRNLVTNEDENLLMLRCVFGYDSDAVKF